MAAMIDETLGKRRSYGEPSARVRTLKRVLFVKKMGIDVWLLQIWAQLLTNFLYLRLAFTLQDNLVPMLFENLHIYSAANKYYSSAGQHEQKNEQQN